MSKEIHYQLLVLLADVAGCIVLLEVVVLLSQSEAALMQGKQVVLAILDVGIDEETEPSGNAVAFHIVAHSLQLGLRGSVLDTCYVALDRFHTFLVQFHTVHHAVEHRGYLLSHAARLVLHSRYAVDERAQLFVVVFLQHVEAAVAAVFSRQGIGLLPSARCVHIEVRTWQICGVQVGEINTRRKLRLVFRCAGRHHCCQCHYRHKTFEFHYHILYNYRFSIFSYAFSHSTSAFCRASFRRPCFSKSAMSEPPWGVHI